MSTSAGSAAGWPAAGGFINISQNARTAVFVGSSTAGVLPKFVPQVEQRPFSGDQARRRGTLFFNFERLVVRTADHVEAVRREIDRRLTPLGEKVYGVVDHDHFVLDPQVEDAWAQMVHERVDRHDLNVVRHTPRASRAPSAARRCATSNAAADRPRP
jgi:hypothetical protein